LNATPGYEVFALGWRITSKCHHIKLVLPSYAVLDDIPSIAVFMKTEFLCCDSWHGLSFLQAACPKSSVTCCIRSIFGFCQILIHFQQYSCSFVSSSLARSFPSSCTWSFSRPIAYLETAQKNYAPLEPQHHVCVDQKIVPFFLASFSLVPISLKTVFPGVLNLAARERSLTSYP